MPEINGINVPFVPKTTTPQSKPLRAPAPPTTAFGEILQQVQSKLRFSAHALDRLRSRGLYPSASEMQALLKGLELAAAKGARNAVIVIGNKAFVASVENNTIITALDRQQLEERIVTNIDAAVFL